MNRKFNKQRKLHIRKDDTVMVISGNHKGKSGKVLEILGKKDRVIVEGVNMITKHIKPSAANPEGGLEKTEAGIHISNLMFVEPSSGEQTRIGRKRDEEGKLRRYSKKTGEIIK